MLVQLESLEGGGCLGADNLLELLKNYCRSQNLKRSITVGIIGYPNTGKSSLINSLKRSKAAAVGARPGFTRTMQEIKLDKDVVLLDCPGIVFSNTDDTSADMVLRNAVEMEKIADPVPVVDAVLRRCSRERLMELYQIPTYRSGEEFLAHVSHKIGKLKKGGVPDYRAAAVTVLRDWQTGKIKFYTLPPERATAVVSSEVVSGWAKEFNLDAVVQREKTTVVAHLKSAKQLDKLMEMEAPAHSGADDEFAAMTFGAQGMEQSEEEEEEEDAVGSESADPYESVNDRGGKLVTEMPVKRKEGVKKRVRFVSLLFFFDSTQRWSQPRVRSGRRRVRGATVQGCAKEVAQETAEEGAYGPRTHGSGGRGVRGGALRLCVLCAHSRRARGPRR